MGSLTRLLLTSWSCTIVASSVLLAAPAPDSSPAFVENLGQWPGGFSFVARAGGVKIGLDRDGLSLRLEAAGGAAVVRLEFEGSLSGAEPQGLDVRAEAYHFFLGPRERWREHVPAYRRVRWSQPWPGVALELREPRAGAGAGGGLEYDLLLEPGARLDQIVIRADGVEAIAIEASGELLLETAAGTLRQSPPLAWQRTASGGRLPRTCRFRLLGPRRFGFEAEALDPHLPLLIDPVVSWALPLGSSGRLDGSNNRDAIWDLELAPGGVLVAVGQTSALDFPFAAPPGAACHDGELDAGGSFDACVLRLDAASGEVISTTIVGGAGDEGVLDLALDADGGLHLGGYTSSAEFPVTNDSAHGGLLDAFAARLDAAGCALEFSTLLPTTGESAASAVAALPGGDTVVAGYTMSGDVPIPVEARGFAPGFAGGGSDAFVARLRPGSGESLAEQLVYSTYFGGSAWEARGDDAQLGSFLVDRFIDGGLVATGDDEIAYAGRTWSMNLPTTPNALQPTRPGPASSNGYVMLLKLVPALARSEQLVYSTYLGGAANGDAPRSIAADGAGGFWISGITWASDFPLTADAYQRQYRGGFWGVDAFVAHLVPDLHNEGIPQLAYSSFLGGSEDEWNAVLALRADGSIAIAGETESTAFPLTSCPVSDARSGQGDGFLAVLDPRRSGAAALRYSTYIGGFGWDAVRGLAAGPNGGVFLGLDAGSGPLTGVEADAFSNVGVVLGLELQLPTARMQAAPGSGPAPLPVTFDAGGSTSPGAIAHAWAFGDGTTGEGPNVPHTYTSPGRYCPVLTVTSDQCLTDTATTCIQAACPASDTSPWAQAAIGAAAFSSSAWRDESDLRLCAGGTGILSRADSCFFLHQTPVCDTALTVRIAALEAAAVGAQAGLMAREDLGSGARHAALLLERRAAGLEIRWVVREAAGAASRSVKAAVPAPAVPDVWLRLERQGDRVAGRYSQDGATWHDAGEASLSNLTLVGVAAAGKEPAAELPFEPLRVALRNLRLEPCNGDGLRFRRGHVNEDQRMDLSDAVTVLGYLFLGAPQSLGCEDAADANDDGKVDIADAVRLLGHLFLGTEPPGPPFPECGTDPTEDELGCATAPCP